MLTGQRKEVQDHYTWGKIKLYLLKTHNTIINYLLNHMYMLKKLRKYYNFLQCRLVNIKTVLLKHYSQIIFEYLCQ